MLTMLNSKKENIGMSFKDFSKSQAEPKVPLVDPKSAAAEPSAPQPADPKAAPKPTGS